MCSNLEQQRKQVLEAAERLTEAQQVYMQGVAMLEQNNFRQAADFISRAAEMGDATAQCQLGHLCENGFFGEPNEEEAVLWYRKSADQCHPQGQFRLAVCYELGKGIEQDWEEAARLFELAARRGHSEASECLQMLHDMGVGEPPSPNDEPFLIFRPTTLLPMPPLPPDLDDPTVTDAVGAYRTLAVGNDGAAQLKLGLAYYVGRSVPANCKLACFWVMRSIMAGERRATQYLQFCTREVPFEEHGTIEARIFLWSPGQPEPQL
jgi:TPR repeat protein